jgi:hypothetical protein
MAALAVSPSGGPSASESSCSSAAGTSCAALCWTARRRREDPCSAERGCALMRAVCRNDAWCSRQTSLGTFLGVAEVRPRGTYLGVAIACRESPVLGVWAPRACSSVQSGTWAGPLLKAEARVAVLAATTASLALRAAEWNTDVVSLLPKPARVCRPGAADSRRLQLCFSRVFITAIGPSRPWVSSSVFGVLHAARWQSPWVLSSVFGVLHAARCAWAHGPDRDAKHPWVATSGRPRTTGQLATRPPDDRTTGQLDDRRQDYRTTGQPGRLGDPGQLDNWW